MQTRNWNLTSTQLKLRIDQTFPNLLLRLIFVGLAVTLARCQFMQRVERPVELLLRLVGDAAFPIFIDCERLDAVDHFIDIR